jgi:hypothetical protein
MTNFQRTAAWLHACGKGKTVKNTSVQIGCDLEEQAEFLQCLELDDGDMKLINDRVRFVASELTYLGNLLKRGQITARIPKDRRAEALDALCDREVTGNGIAYLADMDKEGADQAVLDANDAKLIDGVPVILEGGKIGKPEGWTPANITPFV